MKRIIAFILLMLFVIGISCAQDSVTIKSSSSTAIMLFKDAKALKSIDMENSNKQLIAIEKVATFDSIIASKVTDFISYIEDLRANSPPPDALSKISRVVQFPPGIIDKVIRIKNNIYYAFNIVGLVSIIITIVLAVLFFHKDWVYYVVSLATCFMVGWLTLYILPAFINGVFNPDYQYIQTLIQLSG